MNTTNTMSDLYDVIVIGGGAAGLSGALTLARARRRVLVIDAGEPRNAPAGHVHNYLGREGTPPRELVAIGRAEAAQYGAEFLDAAVTSARRKEDAFHVETKDTAVSARRLLVASGAVDVLPDIPGVAERFGSTVLHCPYCHGWEVRDQAIGVIATGSMAEHAAKLWTQWTDDVILFANGRAVGDAGGRYRIVEGPVAKVGDTGVHLQDGRHVERSALVVQTRVEARAGFLAELGLTVADLEMNGESVATYVPADPMGKTAVDGIWVAGNVTDPMGQVITAAAAGMRAGAVINMDLLG